jgi:hypothetical protein
MNAACAFWPLESGGLNVFNPFIEVSYLKRLFDEYIKDKVYKSDFSELEIEDENIYKRLKASHEKSQKEIKKDRNYHIITEYMSYEDYLTERLAQFGNWGTRFDVLMDIPSFRITYKWDSEYNESNYEEVLKGVYGDILLEKFGTTCFLDESVIPMGMIETDLKNAEIDWQC